MSFVYVEVVELCLWIMVVLRDLRFCMPKPFSFILVNSIFLKNTFYLIHQLPLLNIFCTVRLIGLYWASGWDTAHLKFDNSWSVWQLQSSNRQRSWCLACDPSHATNVWGRNMEGTGSSTEWIRKQKGRTLILLKCLFQCAQLCDCWILENRRQVHVTSGY